MQRYDLLGRQLRYEPVLHDEGVLRDVPLRPMTSPLSQPKHTHKNTQHFDVMNCRGCTRVTVYCLGFSISVKRFMIQGSKEHH